MSEPIRDVDAFIEDVLGDSKPWAELQRHYAPVISGYFPEAQSVTITVRERPRVRLLRRVWKGLFS